MEQEGVKLFEIQAQGKSTLAKMLSRFASATSQAITWQSYAGVDPTPVKTINYLKDTLKQNGVRDKIVSEFALL